MTAKVYPKEAHMPARKPGLPANPELLIDLVAANRILAMHGVLDAYGHVSVRSDRKPGHFHMARSLAPQLVTVADLMEHGPDSEPIADERKGYLERYIHGEMYRQRPDVMAVVHSHSDSVIPFGVTKGRMRPVYHMASFLWTGVPVFDIRKTLAENDLLIRDRKLGRELAGSLGACACVLMRGHGMTVVGDSLQEVVFRSIYTEMNARLQTLAGQLEGPIEFLSDEEGRRATVSNRGTIERPWELWKEKAMGRDSTR
jgi:ribulose-5-phosphate 4-epimerase/fuculose-1-phosphate aldolase